MDTQILSLLQQAATFFEEQRQQAYLVGGSLRNLILAEPCVDWDIVTDGDAPTLARRLADTLGGFYAHLHEKASRVVVKLQATDETQERQEIVFDIAPLKGNTLEQDLRLRDFTLNAIASPISSVVEYCLQGTPLHFIDPTHGVADLEARRLKAVDSEVFRHDPLRMLRAIRLMARYNLTIDNNTQGLLMRDATLLSSVAHERIHEELYAILKLPGVTRQLRYLDAHGLLTILFPEFIPARGMPQPSPHYWDVLDHSLETVGMMEQLATLLQQEPEVIAQSAWECGESGYLREIQQLLLEAEGQNIFSRDFLTTSRMKLAALLHDIGKPPTYTVDEEGGVHFYGHPQAGVPLVQQIGRRLSVSTQDRRLLQQVAAHHMRPGQLGQDGPVTPRAIRRYFVDLGPTGIAIALFSLADHLGTRGPQPLTAAWERHVRVVCELLTNYIRYRTKILPPRLVGPDELIRRFKLEPGPVIGQLLEQLAEAQADGLIHSREEALWWVEENFPDLP